MLNFNFLDKQLKLLLEAIVLNNKHYFDFFLLITKKVGKQLNPNHVKRFINLERNYIMKVIYLEKDKHYVELFDHQSGKVNVFINRCLIELGNV